MKKIACVLSLATICGGLMAASVAQAETVVFQDRDRLIMSDWVLFNNKGCPAGSKRMKIEHFMGLGKPSYRCTVGAENRVTIYRPGTTLPSTVTYTELPSYVVEDLPPLPSGQVYVTADNNIYLIDPKTRTVIDSVTVVGGN